MRLRFKQLSIGNKLKVINLLIATLLALLTSFSLSLFLYKTLMDDYHKDADNLTRVLADNLNSTLVFNDTQTAQTTLEGLVQADDVQFAGLYDASGRLFASYRRAGKHPPLPASFTADRPQSDEHFLKASHEIVFQLKDPADNTTAIGTLVLSQSLARAYEQLRMQLAVLLLTGLVAFALLILLLNHLQHLITQPLLALTDTMRQIRQGKDLFGRAQITSHDEIGELAHSFNHLMAELQQRDEERNEATMRFEALLRAVPDLMIELDHGGRYLNVWGGRGDLLIAPTSELIGRRVTDVMPLAAAQEVLKAMEETDAAASGHSFGRRIVLPLPQGGEHWFELSATKYRGRPSQEASYIFLSRDITERRNSEDEIRQLAFYDVLTHLPNRRLLMDRLQTALSHSARTQQFGAILFMDMDRFKTINDTLGHDHGDLMLLEVAKRIQLCLREADTVARLGGDEFVVLLGELDTEVDLATRKSTQVAEKIRSVLAAPYQLNAHERYSSPSIGVCMYLGNEVCAEDLVKNADVAMYQAKDDGRNAVRFFDQGMQQAMEARAVLDTELRTCVLEQQLRLFYQIQVDHHQRPLGAEALVRWVHPTRGLVPPAHFIGQAEESALIVDIGNWVIKTACQQLKTWAKHTATQDLTIAVNVSAQQFKQPQFVDLITAAVQHHGITPSLLKLELTESVILTDVSNVIAKMQVLKKLGVGLSLDDFGTGYSSLSYLKQLPLDQIKIDQSFVRDIEKDPNDAVMVRSIIELARNFKLGVIAEGVETLAQLDFLLVNGCREFQGYYFNKPVPIEELEKLLARPEADTAPAKLTRQ
jgi:diguanylate cyclase (GGDEF)-like protein/PAS domain S-box-containing protein